MGWNLISNNCLSFFNVRWLILNFFKRRYFSLKKGVKQRYLEKVLFLLSKYNNKPSFLCLHIESIFTTSTSRWNGAYIHTYKPFKPFSTSTHLCNLIYMKFVTKQTCFFFHTFIKREKTHFLVWSQPIYENIFLSFDISYKTKIRKAYK